MYYYFQSKNKMAIKLSGVYLGTTGSEPKKCDLLSRDTLIEALSLDGVCDNFCFTLSTELLLNPPEYLTVTDLKGGYLLYIKERYTSEDFKVLTQEKFSNATVTLFFDKGLRLSIETCEDFFAKTLYEKVQSAEIKRLNDSRLVLIALSLNGGYKRLLIFRLDQKIRLIFDKKVKEYILDKDLTVIEKLSDIKKHQITTVLDFDGEKIKEKSVSVNFSDDFNYDKVIEEVIPYVFLEDFLVNHEYLYYLSENIKGKAKNISTYLKDYCAVIPPPMFRNQNEIGLVYKKTENLYYVNYFTFTLENRKIVNFNKLEY